MVFKTYIAAKYALSLFAAKYAAANFQPPANLRSERKNCSKKVSKDLKLKS